MSAKPDMMLWLSDSRGVYIPRDFANSFVDRAKHVSGVAAENWEILEAGPDIVDDSGERVECYYWDAWQEVCDSAVVTDDKGHKYTIWQDGDCWLVPEGMKWNDETDSFDWPDERETKEQDQ